MSDEETTKPEASPDTERPLSPTYEEALKTIFGNVWDAKMQALSIEVDRVVRSAEELNITHKAILDRHKECVSKEEFAEWRRRLEDLEQRFTQ